MNLRLRYKSNRRKRVIRFFTFYSFLALFLILHNTFARYTTVLEGAPRVEVAKWKIKINGNDIDVQDTITNAFTLIPTSTTQTTTNNKLAPGQTGNFDIVINPEGAEVSMVYTISFDLTNVPEGVGITRYEIIEEGITNKFNNVSIEGEINLNENLQSLTYSDTRTVRIYWEWSENTENIPTGTENYNVIASISVKQKISN